MRVGIVADIHCNIAGLERGLELMGDIDALFCAGDSVFQFRWSNEVIERLRDLDAS
ncbi:MAG: metallophosphoesterase family protein [Dehalococcoidia bacterium]|nr:metallophosphoesterase family protein [Dehalococcoidia bacterium]